MQEKKVTKVGWLPVEEKISETWRDMMMSNYAFSVIAVTKKEAEFQSKTGEARKVKVTLSLKVEDV